ncbi:F0F1 ATP synthase subunit A [Rubritalea profundi]|uniref:ATP synthase subunit a n=1 Tax=Rubritalea profundi TaxID=1658618 RepID=A0A2S7TZS3_9BACT|nr:F0F1 ATP synthase subunit A [Rubritalea profundi]PQJ28248.1 ATP synthase F0 subunit A [Rubritalea profundi]
MAKKTTFLPLFFLCFALGLPVAVADEHHDAHSAATHVEHVATEHAGEANAESHEKHEAPMLPKNAVALHQSATFLTNSYVMTWLSVLVIVLFCRAGAGKLSMIPVGFQNFAEWVIESLYNFFAGILGDKLAKRTFWFFGSTFLLIIISNYMGLIPGVGTVGWGKDLYGHMHTPLLRGGNADVNMTAAMAFTFALLWFYWAITENGFKGFIAHIFAPKGDFKGLMVPAMILIFGLVGVLEMISIAIRPVALSFRLFGNIYGGEQTLETLMGIGGVWAGWATSLPFYFMELLVGGVQALVFTLLCAVFLKLICEHSDHDEEEAH